MGNFYLDIETTGLDPEKDKILTIQYQELERNTGEAKGELIILKEWESSEKEIIQKFIANTSILDAYAFSFVPVGYNLGFEHKFLKQRAIVHHLPPIDILNNPFIDLRAIGILMNGGEFKGSGLDKLTGKISDGKNIPILYNNSEYESIVSYIQMETREFIKFNSWLYKKLPDLLKEFDAAIVYGKKEEKVEAPKGPISGIRICPLCTKQIFPEQEHCAECGVETINY
ncbi:MAG: ribonuclease H-like domain-containing protein [archaeon]